MVAIPANPFRALGNYLLGEDDHVIPPLPGGLDGDVAAGIVAHLTMLVEFQNTEYASLYLDRLGRFFDQNRVDARTFRNIAELLAYRMSFNDPVRVAQIALGRAALGPGVDDLAIVDGLYRPEVEEVVAMLPVGIADSVAYVLTSMKMLRGRMRIRFSTFRGRVRLRMFVLLRRVRPMSLRYKREQAAIERWLHMIDRALAKQPDAAPQVIRSASIIRGCGASYRIALGNWHFLIDNLAKPVFDGAIVLPQLPEAMAQALATLAADPGGEQLRKVVAGFRSRAMQQQGAVAHANT